MLFEPGDRDISNLGNTFCNSEPGGVFQWDEIPMEGIKPIHSQPNLQTPHMEEFRKIFMTLKPIECV